MIHHKGLLVPSVLSSSEADPRVSSWELLCDDRTLERAADQPNNNKGYTHSRALLVKEALI